MGVEGYGDGILSTPVSEPVVIPEPVAEVAPAAEAVVEAPAAEAVVEAPAAEAEVADAPAAEEAAEAQKLNNLFNA
jgi:hypothetical protein